MHLGTLATGGAFDDTDSVKWMRSLYPVASWNVGGIDDPGPGLRVAFRTVTDNALENRVNQTDDACNSLRCTTTATKRTCCDAGESDADCAKRLADEGGMATDDRNMCAGAYVVQQLQAMRTAGTIPRDRYIYGSIAYATAPATQFTRGFNPSGETIAVGPMKDPSNEQNYMAHEIGHAIGRGHPSSGAAPVCPNQSADDNAYPYVNARFAGRLIAGGPFGGPNVPDEIAHARMDFGPFGNSTIRIVGASTAGDIMSYCAPYGISPYNYAAVFSRLSFQPLGIAAGGPGGAGGAGAGQAGVPGDWLLALGNFPRDSGAGAFGVVRRLDSVVEARPLVDGGYVLELRGGDDTLLASHAFTPRTNSDAAHELGFELVVPFAPGTRALRVVERATSRIVARRAVSASRPVLSGVQLSGSTGPVTGGVATNVVTVQWIASDADGDPLTYDLYYTHNGGTTWQPIALSLQGTSAPVDTATLAGGTGQFRIEASDGAQNTRAETAPFQIANKPPSVRIINPVDGFRTQWGVVTFESDVRDPQEQALSRDSLVWSSASRVLGRGAGISVADLDVGSNIVTLTATSTAGLTATATVTVVMGDELRLPGPLLSAAPSRVSWSLGGRESASQTSTIVVSNGGGEGALGFVVASSQPWLTVNGAASATLTAPATLTITADPAGMADLSTTMAERRLTSVADALDVLVVPVTLLKGNLVSGQPATEEQTCIVATGETLATIAKREYGDARQWPRIFKANRDRLSDPNVIVPGQKLRLP
jgi:LysM repeat protein